MAASKRRPRVIHYAAGGAKRTKCNRERTAETSTANAAEVNCAECLDRMNVKERQLELGAYVGGAK